jgi:hypothetical protein
MVVSFVIDWTSVWIGAAVTVALEFVALVIVASVTYRKQKRSSKRRVL